MNPKNTRHTTPSKASNYERHLMNPTTPEPVGKAAPVATTTTATSPAPATGETASSPQKRPNLLSRIDTGDLVRSLTTTLCVLTVGLGITFPDPRFPLVALVGLVIGCWPIVSEALHDTFQRRMSMELSMLIAIIAAAAIGEWVTALVITTFVLLAEILEDLCVDRGHEALSDLMAFLPDTVQVRRGEHGETLETIPLAQLRIGDRVLVPPGTRVPCDGEVTSGESSVDQSHITGEPLPVEIHRGAKVYAGSINQTGAVEIRAQHVGEDSSYGRIVEAVRHAQESKPPVMRLADSLAAWLIYLALGGAVVTFILTRDYPTTISVIVVAGACGVAAGTPLAVLAAIARIARRGAFMKDGAHLEELSAIDTLVFDKTGTLTHGKPQVIGVECVNDNRLVPGAVPGSVPAHVPTDSTTAEPALTSPVANLLRLAASAETYSEHPLGKAIVQHARAHGLSLANPQDFSYQPGKGVSARVEGQRVTLGARSLIPDAPASQAPKPGATRVYVALDGHYAGHITLADTLRDNAREVVEELGDSGLRLVMITGDEPENARAVGETLGIKEIHGGLLPEEKVAFIARARENGRRVAMVGDGVNDAPALARANVGIAMGSGTDIARESADAVLISSDLRDLARVVEVAKRARRIIMFNFLGTILVDVVGMILAGCGFLTPMLAALIHVGSETLFILNSARLIPGHRVRSKFGS